MPTATGAFEVSSATVFFFAAAIRLDRRVAFGRAGTAARRRRGRAGVSGGEGVASARCRDPADGASSASHTAAAARLSRGGRSGVCGASGAGAADRTSSRRDASSHRRLPPAPAQGRAMKQRAQRQWSQRRRPRLSSTPQSGQVKRGGAMVLKRPALTTVAQSNACWRPVQCCGPIPVVTPGAAVARGIANCELMPGALLPATLRNALAVAEMKSGGRAVLR